MAASNRNNSTAINAGRTFFMLTPLVTIQARPDSRAVRQKNTQMRNPTYFPEGLVFGGQPDNGATCPFG